MFNSSNTAPKSVRMRARALAALTAAGLVCSGATAAPSALGQAAVSGATVASVQCCVAPSGMGDGVIEDKNQTTKSQPSPPPKVPYLVVTLNAATIS